MKGTLMKKLANNAKMIPMTESNEAHFCLVK